VRKQAAWALGELADRRAAEALSAALKDKSPEVRKQAAWALGELKQ
jgi:HEAT repeat protein